MKEKIKSTSLSKNQQMLNLIPKLSNNTNKKLTINNQIRASSDRLDFSFCSSNKRINKIFNEMDKRNKEFNPKRYFLYFMII